MTAEIKYEYDASSEQEPSDVGEAGIVMRGYRRSMQFVDRMAVKIGEARQAAKVAGINYEAKLERKKTEKQLGEQEMSWRSIRQIGEDVVAKALTVEDKT